MISWVCKTHTLPVLIINVAILHGTADLLLELLRDLIVAIQEGVVGLAITHLLPARLDILKNTRSGTAPLETSAPL